MTVDRKSIANNVEPGNATAGKGGKVGRIGKSERNLLLAGLACAVVGFAAWTILLTQGLLGNTGLNNGFVWGMFIAVFAFFVGFGAGSQLVFSYIVLSGREELKGLAKSAIALALACAAAAGVAILIDLGNISHIMAMIIGTNFRSPLSWDMVALSLFLVVALLEYISLIAGWRFTRKLAVLGIITAVALQIVEGLLFSLQSSHAWWNTPIMPLDFLVVAFVSGFALMLLVAYVRNVNSAIPILAKWTAICIAVHLVLSVCEFGALFIENTPTSMAILQALGSMWWLYGTELLLPLIAMVILFRAGKTVPRKTALIASVLTIIGLIAHRLMLLYPSYNAPSLWTGISNMDSEVWGYPISTGQFAAGGNTFAVVPGYVPGPLEWVGSLLPLGVALVAVVILWLIADKVKASKARKAEAAK